MKKKDFIDFITLARFSDDIKKSTEYDFEEIKENEERTKKHEVLQKYIKKLKLANEEEVKLSNMVLELAVITEEELLEYNLEYYKVGMREGFKLLTTRKEFKWGKQ